MAALTRIALAVVVAALAAPAPPALELSAEAAYQHIVYLSTAIGPRPAGSDGERRAAEYVARTLRGYGYDVEAQPVEVRVFEALRSDLAVVRPEVRAIPAAALEQSPSSRGALEAPLAFVGLAETVAADLRGSVALIERGVITFAAKVRNAEAAGAVAAIIFNNVPGTFQGTLGAAGPLPGIAALAVSREDGLLLESLAGRGAVVRLHVETRVLTRVTSNVVAAPFGSPAQAVVVGGHYDTVPPSPGANDNASGVAVMLEVARALHGVPLGLGVRFVAFAAEEVGLVGSGAYVERARTETVAMIDLDMEGVGRRFVAAAGGADDTLVLRTLRVAQRLGIAMGRINEERSDHRAFARVGISAVLIHRPDDPMIHTPGDRAERIEPAMLLDPLRVTAALLLDLAGR